MKTKKKTAEIPKAYVPPKNVPVVFFQSLLDMNPKHLPAVLLQNPLAMNPRHLPAVIPPKKLTRYESPIFTRKNSSKKKYKSRLFPGNKG